MHDLGGAHRVAENLIRASDGELDHLPGESPFVERREREKYFEQLVDPRARARRPGDQKRPLAQGQELGIEQEKWECTEMVAMQMRKNDSVDSIGVDAMRLEGDQGGGAEIDQQNALGGLQVEAGVEPASGTESIP